MAGGGDTVAAREWDARLAPLHGFCGVESNPIPVKALLQRLGHGQGLRLPLLPLSAHFQGEAAAMVALARELESLIGREALAA